MRDGVPLSAKGKQLMEHCVVTFDQACQEEIEALKKSRLEAGKRLLSEGIIDGLYDVAIELARLRHVVELIQIEGIPK